MTADRVMLLIDADNVSVEVMEQAIALLIAEHGALHVRRAYCTAESARKHQAIFKRLSIRPMVNLAAGKNSTDIALAVDAIDLVLAERPEVVAIASSDSDFAPLVSRLREKGCRVRGIGQQGKTGAETEQVYDDFVQLAAKPARAARKTPAQKSTRKAAAAGDDGGEAKAVAPRRSRASRAAAAVAAEPVEAVAPARKTPTRRAVTQRAARASAADALIDTAAAPPAVAAEAAPAAKTRSRRSAPRAAAAASPAPAGNSVPPAVLQLLQVLPALKRGETMELQKCAEALRRSGQLSRRNTAQKLFARYPEWFRLAPADEPRQVSLLHGAASPHPGH